MEFCFEQTLRVSRDVLFRFHEDPAHLGLLLAEWPGFRLLRHAGHIQPRAETWFEQRVGGFLPVVMGFRHTVYEPDCRFGETLIHGPFDRFTHLHEFDETTEGTVVRDILEVQLSWQYGGRFATQHLVANALNSAFDFRQRSLRELVSNRIEPDSVSRTE